MRRSLAASSASTAPAVATPVGSARRAPRSWPIGLLGVVIAQGTGGDDDDSDGSTTRRGADRRRQRCGRVAAGEATPRRWKRRGAAASDLAAESAATPPPPAPKRRPRPRCRCRCCLLASAERHRAAGRRVGDTDTASATTTAAAGEAPPAFDPSVPIADEVELGIAGGRAARGRRRRSTCCRSADNPCGTDLDPRLRPRRRALRSSTEQVTPVLIVVDRFGRRRRPSPATNAS